MAKKEHIIRALYQASTEHHLGFQHQVMKLLQLGCHVYGMEIGILSKIESGEYSILNVSCPDDMGLKTGDSFRLGNTICSQIAGTNRPLAIENLQESEFKDHPACKDFLLRSYIGISVIVKGRIFGTLNFSGTQSFARTFNDFDTDIIKLMSVWIGSEFDRLEDMARLQNALSDIEKLKEQLRLTIDASPSAMITTNVDGRIIHVNKAAERLFGYESEELIDETIDVLVPHNIRKAHASHREQFSNRPAGRPMGMRRDLEAARKNGEIIQVEIGLSPVEGPSGRLVLCAVNDLTSRKQFEATILKQAKELEAVNERLSEMARTDALTGLANRRCFLEQLEALVLQADRDKTPISIVMIDVDSFKQFNDKYGHQSGDDALKVVAKSLLQAVRRSDLAARYGGEEFIMVLPNTDKVGAMTIAERSRVLINEQNVTDYNLTASFGVSTRTPVNQDTFDVDLAIKEQIKEADTALYHSKDMGRNRVSHFEDLQ